jgi:hypothetical protein
VAGPNQGFHNGLVVEKVNGQSFYGILNYLHVSSGTGFPHPRNPAGHFPAKAIVSTYDTLLSSGTRTLRNYLIFKTWPFSAGFGWWWERPMKRLGIEGINLPGARALKQAVSIPVLCTGGFQTASVIGSAIRAGSCDGVTIGRPLVANPDLVHWFERGHDRAPKPCTYCNKCLFNFVENPLGCYEESRFERQSLENVETALVARSIKTKLSPVVEIIVATGTCLMLGYGARLVLAGQLTPGALVVFLLYLGKMYKPMRELAKMTDTVSNAAVGFERIREVLETESGVRDLPHARPAACFKGKIEFDKVSFGYNQDQLILKEVSFQVEPGQVAAFVGPTGGGKSTIISLVARFYDPISGVVKIDGTDIRKCTMKSLREQISFVLQETLLFHAPIWENIAYGSPEANREEIIHAAKLANGFGRLWKWTPLSPRHGTISE